MKKLTKKSFLVVLVAVYVFGFSLFSWLKPADEFSATERRALEQFPKVSGEEILSGRFMQQFEEYTLDQFPARDRFRQLKAMAQYYVFAQQDNNGIYIADGYAAELEYPIHTGSLNWALGRLSYVYETYLKDTGSKVYTAVVPDKGYYLAEANGYPALDYDAFFAQVQEKMPWATYIDLTGCLSAEDYYRTDTHWRQERLVPVAQKICNALDMPAPTGEEFTKTLLDRPFYGVYYGQAALPMDPEAMYIMQSEKLQACRVYNYATDSYTSVYDMEKLAGKDMYDVYLSGSQALLRIENPNAATDRELIVFRDSFGSSVTPLLVSEYKTVTLVDIRNLASPLLSQYLEFNGQDVLFLYSTLVLNNGTTLK